MNFWKTRTFKTIESMNNWLAKNDGHIQWNEIYLNNAEQEKEKYIQEAFK